MDDGFHRINAFRKGKFITRIITYSNKEKALFFFTEKDEFLGQKQYCVKEHNHGYIR